MIVDSSILSFLFKHISVFLFIVYNCLYDVETNFI